MNRLIALFVSFFLSTLFLGCGSSASVSSDTQVKEPITISLNARVVDGYIKDAEVCLDSNLNAQCDGSEAVATTSQTGAFGFTNISTTTGSYLSLIASGGTDTATGKPFEGEFKSVIEVDALDSSTYEYLTPLTDLIATNFLAGSKSTQEYSDTKLLVSNAYTIETAYVDQNPMSYSGVYARSQEVMQTLGLLSEATISFQDLELTLSETAQLQRDIKNALLTQIMKEGTLDVVNTVNYLGVIRDITFTEHESSYLDAQLREIKLSIDEFSNTSGLTAENLNNYQVALEEEAEAIYVAMESMDGSTPISVIPVDIDIEEILAISDNNETNTTLPDAGVDPTDPVDSTTLISFGGYAVDGYISESTVCIDLNYNGVCDTAEPEVSSQTNGGYYFTNIEVKKDTVIPVISYGGTDTAISKLRVSQLQNVVDSNSIETLNLTPITDYIAVSFSQESNKTLENLQSGISELEAGFGLSSAELSADPMQDVLLFALSQELDYTRRILENIFELPLSVSLQNEIKEALLEQVVQNSYETISIDRVITTLEIALSASVADVNRAFAIDQIAEIQRVLDLMKASEDIQVYTLPRLQSMVEESVSDAIDTLVYTDINLTTDEVSYSDFSKTDAIYDAQACLSDTQYSNILSDSNTSSTSATGYSEDSTNGLLIKSNGDKVTLFYETLGVSLDGDKITEFIDDENYFAFDRSWEGTSKHMYMKLPKNESNKHTCYRVNIGSDLSKTKVFRYTTPVE